MIGPKSMTKQRINILHTRRGLCPIRGGVKKNLPGFHVRKEECPACAGGEAGACARADDAVLERAAPARTESKVKNSFQKKKKKKEKKQKKRREK